jgi:hypothetical protein
VSWLAKSLSAYAVEPNYAYDSGDASKPQWWLSARSRKRSAILQTSNGKTVRRVLHALHRARSTPMKDALIEKLAGSSNEVVRGFSNCVDVEGRYADRVTRGVEGEHFLAEVREVAAVI